MGCCQKIGTTQKERTPVFWAFPKVAAGLLDRGPVGYQATDLPTNTVHLIYLPANRIENSKEPRVSIFMEQDMPKYSVYALDHDRYYLLKSKEMNSTLFEGNNGQLKKIQTPKDLEPRSFIGISPNRDELFIEGEHKNGPGPSTLLIVKNGQSERKELSPHPMERFGATRLSQDRILVTGQDGQIILLTGNDVSNLNSATDSMITGFVTYKNANYATTNWGDLLIKGKADAAWSNTGIEACREEYGCKLSGEDDWGLIVAKYYLDSLSIVQPVPFSEKSTYLGNRKIENLWISPSGKAFFAPVHSHDLWKVTAKEQVSILKPEDPFSYFSESVIWGRNDDDLYAAMQFGLQSNYILYHYGKMSWKKIKQLPFYSILALEGLG